MLPYTLTQIYTHPNVGANTHLLYLLVSLLFVLSVFLSLSLSLSHTHTISECLTTRRLRTSRKEQGIEAENMTESWRDQPLVPDIHVHALNKAPPLLSPSHNLLSRNAPQSPSGIMLHCAISIPSILQHFKKKKKTLAWGWQVPEGSVQRKCVKIIKLLPTASFLPSYFAL